MVSRWEKQILMSSKQSTDEAHAPAMVEALYRARQLGRNRVELADAESISSIAGAV